MMENKIIDGRFLVLKKLGKGAAGDVYEASVLRNTAYATKGTRVAIKIYKPWVIAKDSQGYRIERELNRGITVSSPNVVKTYEIGGFDNNVFLVMERLDGMELRRWIIEHKKMTFKEVIKIVTGIADGLYCLHSKDLIHRDIKPENIMLTSRGPVIMDLGVLRDTNTETAITEKDFIGTIKYAAPEYLFGEEYGSDIDIYSFGLIVRELLTGEPPYGDDLYWSKQIVKKRSEIFSIDTTEFKVIEEMSLREKIFLRATIEGCISTVRFNDDFIPQKKLKRLSSDQLHKALANKVWKKTFNYPIWFGNFDLWPQVPIELEKEVAEFASQKLRSLPQEAAEILWHLAFQFDGDLDQYGAQRYRKPDRLPLFERLLTENLVEKGYIDIGVIDYSHVTPLGWQILFRGLIDSKEIYRP
jgi:serine/threonine protein kinase